MDKMEDLGLEVNPSKSIIFCISSGENNDLLIKTNNSHIIPSIYIKDISNNEIIPNIHKIQFQFYKQMYWTQIKERLIRLIKLLLLWITIMLGIILTIGVTRLNINCCVNFVCSTARISFCSLSITKKFFFNLIPHLNSETVFPIKYSEAFHDLV